MYASRQPRAPQRQSLPPYTIVVWPPSPALLVDPRYVVPSVTTAAPTPEPISAITAWRAPRPAPNHISAWPCVFAPLSTNNGKPTPASRNSETSGTASQPTVGACTSTRDPCSTVPGTPMPTPSTAESSMPALANTSRSPDVTCSTAVAGSGAFGRGCSTVARRFIARSNSSTLTPVSPMSTPATCPYAGSTRNSTRGRPPSDSTWPASVIRRSSPSSAVTLLTVAALNTVSWLSSCRDSGPSKYSFDSSRDRLCRRRSRTVVRLLAMGNPSDSYRLTDRMPDHRK